MEAYIERMVEEKRELDGRIQKLFAFVFSDKGDELLDEKQRAMMEEQAISMTRYRRVLTDRIRYEKIKTGVVPDPDAGKTDMATERAGMNICSPK